jgi:hypothetical protein
MISRGILTFITTIIVSALIFAACDVISEKSFEESLAPYLELESITEGPNSSIVVNRGSAMNMDSYFTFNVKSNTRSGLIREGLKEGWCLEWDKPIAQNGDLHEGVEFYSTFGSETWKPANYLLNIKDELKNEDPKLTYKEIQVALWSVIDNPKFILEDVLKAGDMPSRLMRDGQPDFDIARVKSIVDRVRSNYNNYSYKPSIPFITYARTENSSQNGGFLACDQTAWAANGDTPGVNRYVTPGNWATYVEYNGEEKTVTLFAGQTVDIGTVTFSAPSDNKVTITINLNDEVAGFQNVSENVKIQDYSTAPSGNPQIGLFDHKGDASGSSFEIEVPENNYYGVHIDSSADCELFEDLN